MAISEKIPKLALNSGHVMPVVGMGTAEYPSIPEKMKSAYLDAIAVGYRHFDTASLYNTEQPLGEAIQEAIKLGLIGSREELFVTSKLWCPDNHPNLVLPAIKSSLKILKTDYLDLYLIHWPMSVKPGSPSYPLKREDVVPLDLKGVWQAMEECQRLGLTKSIGVSNFTSKKLEEILSFAKIPPAVDQTSLTPPVSQCQAEAQTDDDDDDYDRRAKTASNPLVASLFYGKIRNMTRSFSHDTGQQLDYCIKDSDKDWNEAFNFSSDLTFVTSCMKETNGGRRSAGTSFWQ